MYKSVILKNIVVFYLVLMCVQIIPIEGIEVSNVKVAGLIITPILLFFLALKLTKATFYGFFYIIIIFFSIGFNLESFRFLTVAYKISFITMFMMYYNLIHSQKALNLENFIRILKGLLWAYIICLLLQQVALIIGLQSVPIINLVTFLDRGIGSNSLSLEPSHSARIMTVLFISLIRMHEVLWETTNIPLNKFLISNKWLLIGFLWSMVTMGSGTAFAGLLLISIYFLKKQYISVVLPVILIFYIVLPFIDYEPLNRVQNTIDAFFTLNQGTVIEADHSASARIVPLLNTIFELDFLEAETWIGKGIDFQADADYLSKEQTVGGITDYGLLAYIASIIFVFATCIPKFRLVETLIFIVLLGAGVGNVAYVWGILLLLTTTTYFVKNEK